MYAYIKGKIEAKGTNFAVLEAGNIGYKVYMSETDINNLGDLGQERKVYTYLKVREDDVSLYGFLTQEALNTFELLISVGGIGAKSAISILSNIAPSKFALAVISNDINTLKKLPGIGAKTAQRIILELKDKLKAQDAIENTQNLELQSAIRLDDKQQDAVSALQVLGYARRDIEECLTKFDTKSLSVEDIIKKALIYLARN